MAWRWDQGALRSWERTPSGGLRLEAALGRVGLLTYRDGAGKEWLEYRPAEEAFDAASLASMQSAPVTLGHPPGMVQPETWKQYACGHVEDVPRRDGDFIVASVAIQDASAIARIEAGALHDVSLGYQCVVDPTPGVYQGVRYDQVQRHVRANHVALLPKGEGRAGPDVSLRLDGAAVEVERSSVRPQEQAMITVQYKGRTYRCDAEADMASLEGEVAADKKKADADLEAKDAKISELMNQCMTLLKQVAALEAGEKAAADAKKDADEKPSDEDKDKASKDDGEEAKETPIPEEVLDARAEARVTLRAHAARILGGKPDHYVGQPTRDLQRKIVEQVGGPQMKLDALVGDALAQSCELAIKAWSMGGPKPRNDRLAAVHVAAVGGGATPAAESTSLEEAYAAQRARAEQRWMRARGSK